MRNLTHAWKPTVTLLDMIFSEITPTLIWSSALTTGVILIITHTAVWQISPLIFISAHLSCSYMLKRLISPQKRHSCWQMLRIHLVAPTETCVYYHKHRLLHWLGHLHLLSLVQMHSLQFYLSIWTQTL